MRQVLAVDLKDDSAAIATYVEHHQRVWPEVLRSLREAGIERMDILLLGRRLVMIVESRGDFRDAFESRVASDPKVAQWETLMRSLQEPAPGRRDGEWWAEMRPVFQFNATEPCPI
jgi:L-rhamnose mutarotase